MAQVYVSGSLHCSFGGHVSLPDGKSWKDVSSWYVKWDNLNFEIDGVWHEVPLHSDTTDTVDWKRPIEGSVDIYASVDDDIDYDVVLAVG